MGGAVRRVTLSFLPACRELVVRVELGESSIDLGLFCPYLGDVGYDITALGKVKTLQP